MKEIVINVCPNHQRKEVVPLIWTFAFNGYEFWCPACGALFDMFGCGSERKYNFRLKRCLEKYKKLSGKFLRAKSLLACSYTIYKGKQLTFEELPQRVKTYWINRSKEYKYKFK